jgi:hypothetical protein
MLTANFKNTENSIDLTVGLLSMPSINEGQFFLGSTERTIDGTLITYANGHKNELSISAQNMSRADIAILRTCQRNQYTIDFTITDDYTGIEVISYNGVIEDFSPDFDNYSRLFNATLKVLEL